MHTSHVCVCCVCTCVVLCVCVCLGFVCVSRGWVNDTDVLLQLNCRPVCQARCVNVYSCLPASCLSLYAWESTLGSSTTMWYINSFTYLLDVCLSCCCWRCSCWWWWWCFSGRKWTVRLSRAENGLVPSTGLWHTTHTRQNQILTVVLYYVGRMPVRL